MLCGSALKNKGVQPMLDAVVDFLPSPLDRPPVKAPPQKGETAVVRNASDSEPFAALAFKIATDPFVGKLTFFRVYSGVLAAGSYVYNATKGERERVGRLLQMHANHREEIEEVARRRHRRRHRPAQDHHRRHALRREVPDRPRADHVPGAGHLALRSSRRPRRSRTRWASRCRSSPRRTRRSASAPTRRPGQTIISGMGELHLEIIVDRMLREFKVDANVGKPQVAYRETVTAKAHGTETLRPPVRRSRPVRPCRAGDRAQSRQGIRVRQQDHWRHDPARIHRADRTGIADSLSNGVLAGYPVVDVKVTLVDGSYHDVDSSEQAFYIAGSMGFKDGVRKAKPVLLEPIMRVDVFMPEEFMGDVMGDLSGRRGQILGMEGRATSHIVHAEVPLSAMFGYPTDLRSMTQGRANYSMEFHHYQPASREPRRRARRQSQGVIETIGESRS